jgi:hypothetical protein
VKIKALKMFHEKSHEDDKARPFFIVSITHKLLDEKTIQFEMKVVELDKSPIIHKSQLQNATKKYTLEPLVIEINDRDVNVQVEEFS